MAKESKLTWQETLDKIDKDYGAGSVWTFNEDSVLEVDVIPTGCISLDIALGVGGWPRGRVVEIYGPESAGKSTVALHAVLEAQRLGLKCLYLDVENAFDPTYAKAIGIDINQLLISQPDTGEDALNIARDLIDSGHIGLVIIDSVSALVPRAELAGDIGDASVGAQSRMMSQSLRILVNSVKRTNTCVMFINQLREKIGVMFGSPETTSGGRALKFYSSVRCDIRRKETIKQDGIAEANLTKVRVIKNKVAAPYKECEFNIQFGVGIDKYTDILDTCVEYGIVKKSGAWYSYDDLQLGQGRSASATFLKDNSELADSLYDKVVEEVNVKD